MQKIFLHFYFKKQYRPNFLFFFKNASVDLRPTLQNEKSSRVIIRATVGACRSLRVLRFGYGHEGARAGPTYIGRFGFGCVTKCVLSTLYLHNRIIYFDLSCGATAVPRYEEESD